jgi:hypothetical protein
LAFSDNVSNPFNDSGFEPFENKMIILKKVKSLRQLRRSEKELVRLCYKEAIIKGFTLKGIQEYIASKTKIWIEWSCLEFLKKAEEQEDKEWYTNLAYSHLAYVKVYRKAIDEVEEYKKHLWLMVMDLKVEHSTKVQALRELHSLSKTYTLLLKDLPFVTRLTKYYDKEALNLNYNDIHSNRNNQQFDKIKNTEHFNQLENMHNKNDVNYEDRKIITNNNNNLNSNKNHNKIKHVDDEVMEEIIKQDHMTDCLKGKRYDEITQEDLEKVIPEYKEAIRKAKELLDE